MSFHRQLHHQASSGNLIVISKSFIIDRQSRTLTLSVMPATTAETLSLVSRNVSVAPLVLLSAADHFGRSGKGLRKRVVGVLLGQNDGKNVRVSNSFAGMHLISLQTRGIWLTNDGEFQYPSKKMRKTHQYGSWTTITSRA